MTRVLVLTKNVLTDVKFQSELQQLNYEVLVSSSIYESLANESLPAATLEPFSLIIFSETLIEAEIMKVLPLLAQQQRLVIQRTYGYPSDKDRANLSEQGIVAWSIVGEPVIELKKIIEQLMSNYKGVHAVRGNDVLCANRLNLFQQLSFTPTEVKILQLLYLCQGKVVVKEEMCEKIWNQTLTSSRKVQIYTVIGNLRDKIGSIKPNIVFIGAQRGSGYYLTEEFYHSFDLDFSFLVAN